MKTEKIPGVRPGEHKDRAFPAPNEADSCNQKVGTVLQLFSPQTVTIPSCGP